MNVRKAKTTIYFNLSKSHLTNDALGILEARVGWAYEGANYTGQDALGLEISNLIYRAQCDKDGRWYGWGAGYKDVYAMDERKAKSMYTSLRKINKSMTKQSEAIGGLESDVQRLLAFAKAVNAKSLRLCDHGPAMDKDGWSEYPLSETRHVYAKIQQWMESNGFGQKEAA